MAGNIVSAALFSSLRLLDSFRLERKNELVHLPRRKLELLLAYLVLIPASIPVKNRGP